MRRAEERNGGEGSSARTRAERRLRRLLSSTRVLTPPRRSSIPSLAPPLAARVRTQTAGPGVCPSKAPAGGAAALAGRVLAFRADECGRPPPPRFTPTHA